LVARRRIIKIANHDGWCNFVGTMVMLNSVGLSGGREVRWGRQGGGVSGYERVRSNHNTGEQQLIPNSLPLDSIDHLKKSLPLQSPVPPSPWVRMTSPRCVGLGQRPSCVVCVCVCVCVLVLCVRAPVWTGSDAVGCCLASPTVAAVATGVAWAVVI
jgi:hypothetical protein